MKIILIAAISADGKIAERPDQTSLDWTSKEDTKFFVEKTKEAGVVVMGARTYATIGKPLKGRRLIVLSREGGTTPVSWDTDQSGRCSACEPSDSSPLFPPAEHRPLRSLSAQQMEIQHERSNRRGPQTPPGGSVEYINTTTRQLVEKMEQEGHDAVVVAGGASVYSQFLRDGLVTDLYLTVEPVLFGNGVPLISGIERINLRFVEMRLLGDQSVLLHYSFDRDA